VHLKPSKPEIITVTTDSKVAKAIEEAKTLLTGDGKVFTTESEVYKLWASFDQNQIDELNKYLTTQYGANRDRTIEGKNGWQVMLKAYANLQGTINS
jgi:hypothetical protein